MHFYGMRHSGNSDGWVQNSLDFSAVPGLGDLRGQKNVWFALVFDSDDSVTDQGVFVHDVLLRKYVGSEPPARSNQRPPPAAAPVQRLLRK
ncbi:MAG: hypothetical protein GXP37_04930 [Chloroflexi bacterium]|nr:hypothetical protein [Chloroflexota bacterium]